MTSRRRFQWVVGAWRANQGIPGYGSASKNLECCEDYVRGYDDANMTQLGLSKCCEYDDGRLLSSAKSTMRCLVDDDSKRGLRVKLEYRLGGRRGNPF